MSHRWPTHEAARYTTSPPFLDGMLVLVHRPLQGYPQQFVTGIHLYTWVERNNVEQSYLSKETVKTRPQTTDVWISSPTCKPIYHRLYNTTWPPLTSYLKRQLILNLCSICWYLGYWLKIAFFHGVVAFFKRGAKLSPSEHRIILDESSGQKSVIEIYIF